MKKLLLSLLILLFAGQVWGATIYTKGISGTTYYDASATSCDDVTAADTASDLEGALTAAGAGGTLNICSGTYIGAMVDAADGLDATAANQTINVLETAVIDMTGVEDQGIRCAQTGFVVNGNFLLTIQNVPTARYGIENTTAGSTYNEIIIRDCVFALKNSATATYNKCKLYDMTGASGFHVNNAGGDNIYNYCLFDQACVGATAGAGTTSTLNNCSFVRPSWGAVWITGAGDWNIIANNCILEGDMAASTHETAYNLTSGTSVITLNYSLTQPNPRNIDKRLSAGVTENNRVSGGIRFMSRKYPAIVVLTIDDWSSASAVASVWELAKARGMPLTWSVNTNRDVTWATVQALYADGVDIVSHGFHSNFTNTYPITVAKAGQTITIAPTRTDPNDYTTWSSIITVSGQDAINCTASTILADLKTSLEAQGCTVTYTAEASAYDLCTNLGAVTDESIDGAGYQVLYDMPSFRLSQVTKSKADLEANLSGYAATVLIYPYGDTDADTMTAVQAAGYLGAFDTGAGDYSMADLEVYNIERWDISTRVSDDSEAVNNIDAMLAYAGALGGIHVFLTHALGETSLAKWAVILDEIKASGVTVMSATDAIAYIRANGVDADGDAQRWTRTLTDQSDYRLNKTSPCINAGTDVGLTEDIRGRAVPKNGAVDIGAYEAWRKILKLKNLFIPSFADKPLSAAPITYDYLIAGTGDYIVTGAGGKIVLSP